MILGPDGKPVDVEPCPLAPPVDPYERRSRELFRIANACPNGPDWFWSQMLHRREEDE